MLGHVSQIQVSVIKSFRELHSPLGAWWLKGVGPRRQIALGERELPMRGGKKASGKKTKQEDNRRAIITATAGGQMR